MMQSMEKPPIENPQPERASRLRPEKRRAILDGAARVFMRDGFGLAGIDDIVAEAGVSKRTLYAHFASKEALFGAIVEEWCDSLLTPLREAGIRHRDTRETLIDLGRMFLDIILSAEGIQLYRVVIAEAPRFPDLGRVFYESGHLPAADLLSSYLNARIEAGEFRPFDSRRAAEGFFQLIAGYAHERMLLCIETEVDPEDIETYLTVAADIFLRGIKRPDAT